MINRHRHRVRWMSMGGDNSLMRTKTAIGGGALCGALFCTDSD